MTIEILETIMQSKLAILALVGGLVLASAVQSYLVSKRLTKAKEQIATLTFDLDVSERTMLAEREAYREALNLAASVRDSEQRLSSLSDAINLGVQRLGDAHEKVDPCFYTIPEPVTVDGLQDILYPSTP